MNRWTRGGSMAMVVCAMALASACTRLTPEQQFVHDVAEALGGADRVKAARLVTLTGTGRQWNLGQDLRPGLAEQTFTVSAFTRLIDLRLPRIRTTVTRTPNFSYYQGPQAQTSVTGLDGDVAYGGPSAERLTRASRTAAIDRQDERLPHPLVLVRAALEGAAVSPVRTTGNEHAVDITTDGGVVTLVVDDQHRPLLATSAGAHPNLGDVTLTTRFSDYAAAGGYTLPGTFATAGDDFTTAHFTLPRSLSTEGPTFALPFARSSESSLRICAVTSRGKISRESIPSGTKGFRLSCSGGSPGRPRLESCQPWIAASSAAPNSSTLFLSSETRG